MPTKAELEEENQQLRAQLADYDRRLKGSTVPSIPIKEIQYVVRQMAERQEWCDEVHEILSELGVELNQEVTVHFRLTFFAMPHFDKLDGYSFRDHLNSDNCDLVSRIHAALVDEPASYQAAALANFECFDLIADSDVEVEVLEVSTKSA